MRMGVEAEVVWRSYPLAERARSLQTTCHTNLGGTNKEVYRP